MVASHARTRRIRTIFISDVHLGCRHSRAGALATFLESHQPEQIYLVGDFIDGWKLKRVWRWLPEYSRLIHRLLELNQSGTRLYYTPGNHDDFLRQFVYDFGLVDVRDEFVFETADGRQILVTHGDKFDVFEKSARWFSMLLSFIYDAILSANRLASKLQRKHKRSSYAFSAAIKLWCKRFAMFLSDFEKQLVEHAEQLGCDGVICGHIHKPDIRQGDGVTYFNTGDWVEHCTALVEYDNGQMELLFMASDDAGERVEIVDRIAERRRTRPDCDHGWHDEFDDGFNNRLPDEWADPEREEFPAPVSLGGTAVKSPALPRNRIRRLAQRLRGWPGAMAAHACRSVVVCSRAMVHPRKVRGFFVGIVSRWKSRLSSDELCGCESSIETA